MKSFAQAMKDIPSNIMQHVQHASDAVTKVLADPNATAADYKDAMRTVDEDFKNALRETGTTASDAARDEWEEHVTRGLNAEEMKKWCEHKAQDVKDLADKGIKAVPKATAAAKAGAFALFAAGVAIFGFVFSTDASNQGQQAGDTMHRNGAMLAETQYNIKLGMDMVQFTQSVNSLNLPSVPPIAIPDDPAPAAAAYIPPVAAMPAPVAAIATEPVAVEVDTGQASYTSTTTVGQVYRYFPAARPQIEQHVSTIEHDYDRDNSAAFAQHLHEESEEWSRQNFPSEHHDVNIDVDAGFASAHFHI